MFADFAIGSNRSHLRYTKPFVGSLKTGPSGPSKTAPPSPVKNSIIIEESQDVLEQDAPVSPSILTTWAARWETAGAAPSQAQNRPLNEASQPDVGAHDFGKDDDDDNTSNTLNDPAYPNHNATSSPLSIATQRKPYHDRSAQPLYEPIYITLLCFPQQ